MNPPSREWARPSPFNQRLWYRRSFNIPAAWSGQRVLLHFGAVNWDCTVAVNGQAGGNAPGRLYGFRVRHYGRAEAGRNELVVSAANPLLYDTAEAQVLGKQRRNSGGIFYTGVHGHLADRLAGTGPGRPHRQPQAGAGYRCRRAARHRAGRRAADSEVFVTGVMDGSENRRQRGTGRPAARSICRCRNAHLWSPARSAPVRSARRGRRTGDGGQSQTAISRCVKSRWARMRKGAPASF